MPGRLRTRLALGACALVLIAVFAYRPLVNLAFSVRLLLAVQSLASGATGENLDFQTRLIKVSKSGSDYQALLYTPMRRSAERTLLLVPGISPQGCYHPRLVALARALANMGFRVLTPDIQSFRRFEIDTGVEDEIAIWLSYISGLAHGARQGVGVAGISFSATLALMVASRPEFKDTVSFVLGIGAYEDLTRCRQFWFSATPRTVSDGYFPTRYYGRWVIMISALDLLRAEADRTALRTSFTRFLNGDTRRSNPPDSLSAEGQRWLRLALMREDESDTELSQSIALHLEPLFQQLSPRQAAARISCPVFLAHGASDDLIPPDESVALLQLLPKDTSRLLISPFLTHTHPLERNFTWSEKAGALWDMAGFFYPLASKTL